MTQHQRQDMQPEMVGVAKEIVKLVNSSTTHINQLSAVLTKEPTLMKSILHKANAPVYGLRDRVQDLNLAIVLLGFDVLKKTVASALVHDALRKIVDTFSKYDDFWHHSLSTAFVGRALAMETCACNPTDAFVAGLLHDIGHLVKQMTQPEFERELFSANLLASTTQHEELGSFLAKQWEITDGIAEAIRFHHQPEQAPTQKALASIVHLSDQLSLELSHGAVHEGTALPLNNFACALLGITKDDMTNLENTPLLESLRATAKESIGEDFSKMVKTTILNALTELPDQEKIVIALRYYDGLNYRDIGQLCGYEAKTAQMLHDQAFQRIKKMFVPESYDGEPAS
ncbi:MAG TPA: HDOD domain-containing protein [Bacteroidota bacterium]|nr:HDOD domain-containing protein [Bacteroidota bacterium]